MACREALVRHGCIRVVTRLKLDNMGEVIGRFTESCAQKRLPSLKVGEAFLYKNDLVYVFLCEDNFENCDLHP
jgi:hypothetical protein